MVACKPYGREGSETQLVNNLVSTVMESIIQSDWMISPRTVPAQVFGRNADRVFLDVEHCTQVKATAAGGNTAIGQYATAEGDEATHSRQRLWYVRRKLHVHADADGGPNQDTDTLLSRPVSRRPLAGWAVPVALCRHSVGARKII
jgi:hypothetical protein